MQLSRGAISAAALSILDEYGLADVSMRRVASSLGVAPGALYWHIENKQELISDLAALIIAPLVDAPPPAPDIACARLRAALLRHRDGAEVVITAVSQPDSPVARRLARLIREAVAGSGDTAAGGASTRDAHAAADGLLYLTLGAAYVHQSAEQLAQATGGTEVARPRDAGADVDRAVELLLAGMRVAPEQISDTINPHD
ncbi:TetR family transcriptional regulator [Corynebacterium timonense]|uniref:DNA-binding transcriptional regulator, AcrR family n=1 Tax=Corynebacterium timonense TaxID=441500 RepID=A0A1H1MRU6_9CORY|nr:TetR family transcriptional regulator [Corynebacterium timonense]SDR89427.1 DNA-binding transcriptional regulator, AcrR family [Corynebacterium timonense]